MIKYVKCQTCNTEFQTKKGKYCSKACRPMREHICIICTTQFFTRKKTSRGFCSKKCQAINQRQLASIVLQDDVDVLTCIECNLKVGKSLTHHLINLHQMTVKEYQTKHNVGIESTTAKSTRKILSDQNSGKLNVWFNHGGKLSPFSKQNNRITEEERIASQSKASQTRIDNGNNTTTLEYWLKQTDGDVEEARRLLKDRQTTFSLDICIEKFGEEGLKIWQARQDQWQITLLSKSQEEQDEIKLKKVSGKFSKVSQFLFDQIDLPSARYYLKNGELGIRLNSGKVVYPDFIHEDRIIEFYGDRWHANPRNYSETDFIPSISKNREPAKVQDIWERDKVRIEQLEELGYQTMIVWEYDYRTSPERMVQECKEFLAR